MADHVEVPSDRCACDEAHSTMAVSIVDYGVGNLGSVINTFKRLGAETPVSNPSEIGESEGVLLPGVGSFDHGGERLAAAGLTEPLKRFRCVGSTPHGHLPWHAVAVRFQRGRDEQGLGLIAGQSRRCESVPGLRVRTWVGTVSQRRGPIRFSPELGPRTGSTSYTATTSCPFPSSTPLQPVTTVTTSDRWYAPEMSWGPSSAPREAIPSA